MKVTFSPRQTQVLVLLRQGLPNKRIARELGVTEHAIESCLTRMFDKTGAENRTQLALLSTIADVPERWQKEGV